MTSGSSAWHDPSGSRIAVVDSWGVLEWVFDNHPGASLMRQRLEAADRGEMQLLVSRLTVGEMFYNVWRRQRLGEFAGETPDFHSLPWQIVSVDDALVYAAAELKAIYPISFADCFVAALARRYDAPVITGDPDFRRLHDADILKVDWIGA